MKRWSWSSLSGLFGRRADDPSAMGSVPPPTGDTPSGSFETGEPSRLDAEPAALANVEAIVQRASERLLGAESLRRNATDDEFKPLLDWALATLMSRAAAAPQRVDALVEQLRALLRAADAALGADRASRAQTIAAIGAEVKGPLFDAPDQARRRLESLAARTPADGESLAAALAAALSTTDQRGGRDE